MSFVHVKSQFEWQKDCLRWVTWALIGSLFLNLILVGLLYRSEIHERTIIVPATLNQAFSVSESTVDANYLNMFATMFIYLRFDVTPSNVEYQDTLLQSFLDPSIQNSLKDTLNSEVAAVKAQSISSNFSVSSVSVDPADLQAKVSGVLSSSVGNQAIPSQNKTYLITFSYHYGRLLITGFSEEDPNDN